jgi:glycerol kinase
VHATDASNASRTLLLDLRTLQWDELCALFGVPRALLPEVRANTGPFGDTRGVPGLPDGVPITGIAGDQQAALFGQACFAPATRSAPSAPARSCC